MSDLADVLIVGAGAAGLEAARKLAMKNLRVVLVEARDRLGGRIHTIHPQGFPLPIDIGAEFVHGKPPQTWEIIKAAHLPVYEITDHHWHFLKNRLRPADDFSEKVDKILAKLNAKGREETFAEFIQKCCPRNDAQTRDMAIAFVQGFNAARADRISTTALAAEQKAADEIGESSQYRIIGGYAPMVAWLEASLGTSVDIRLSTCVREIEWKAGRVEARCTSPTGAALPSITAQRAIVTLPLPALQKDAVRFSPALDAKRSAAQKLEMGSVVKIVLSFREAFWEQEKIPAAKGRKLPPLSFMHSSGDAVPTWWTYLPIKTTVLTGWAGGPKADALSHLKPEQVLRRALDSLSHMLGIRRSKIESLLQAWYVADWQADEFSGGAYSYVPIGAGNARKQLAKPIENTLFFAGEATHFEGQSGTVAGALATGARAAKEVAKSLK
ncbi:MAG TPA: NAD(P)/FAD-dependent oxidoreductase [Tepidisphaeraceae bacterium]|nr:NAD(P)/FAD-dependent oxidoreductase [Tepidisphaeraceae bacterium]